MRRHDRGPRSTDIARTIGEVFDYVVDARNEPKWLPGAKGVEKTTPGDVGLGTRFEGAYARAGKVTLELVEYEPPHRFTRNGTMCGGWSPRSRRRAG